MELNAHTAFAGLRVTRKALPGYLQSGTVMYVSDDRVAVKWDKLGTTLIHPVGSLRAYYDDLSPLQADEIIDPGTKCIVIEDTFAVGGIKKGTQVTVRKKTGESVYLEGALTQLRHAYSRFAIDIYARSEEKHSITGKKTDQYESTEHTAIKVFPTEATVIRANPTGAVAVRG